MIPRASIAAWGRSVGWATDDQVEQDLLLSRVIVEIANDPYLGEELAFRGGTCLHKLHADAPYRYSEDLDYVRCSAGGIADLTRATTAIGERLGMDNTFERSPARDLVRLPFSVESPWYTGAADVLTFSLAELVSTKIRALFDLWLALARLGVTPADLMDSFGPYRPDGYTRARAEQNLRAKLPTLAFRNDLVPLVAAWPEGYDIDDAAELVVSEVFARL
ncbi:MAG: nucleotidyl transferase AbiEii/AbiGii toxin family protein [Acidimicrobiales bacterium]